jgi:hypothetical protein
MKTKTTEVKGGSKIVGEIDYDVFETVQEAIDKLGASTTLDLVNTQHKTKKMNDFRQGKMGKPSKQKLLQIAMTRVTEAEFRAVMGDQTRMEDLLQKKVAEIEAEEGLSAGQEVAVPDGSDDSEGS